MPMQSSCCRDAAQNLLQFQSYAHVWIFEMFKVNVHLAMTWIERTENVEKLAAFRLASCWKVAKSSVQLFNLNLWTTKLTTFFVVANFQLKIQFKSSLEFFTSKVYDDGATFNRFSSRSCFFCNTRTLLLATLCWWLLSGRQLCFPVEPSTASVATSTSV